MAFFIFSNKKKHNLHISLLIHLIKYLYHKGMLNKHFSSVCFPKITIILRDGSIPAIFMHVPKATVYKYGNLIFRNIYPDYLANFYNLICILHYLNLTCKLSFIKSSPFSLYTSPKSCLDVDAVSYFVLLNLNYS